MGNAWIDPAIQYPAYIDYSYQLGLITKGSAVANRAEATMTSCNATLSTTGKGKVLVPECESLLWSVLPPADACVFSPPSAGQKNERSYRQNQCVNVYNVKVRQPCNAEFPPDIVRVQPYLRVRPLL